MEILNNKDKTIVSQWLATELEKLEPCKMTTYNNTCSEILEFRDNNGSCLQLEVQANSSGQIQFSILPMAKGSKPFSGSITVQRIDPKTGELIDLYDNIRIENNKIVEAVYTNPKPTEENSRVANMMSEVINKFSQKAVNDNESAHNFAFHSIL
ncbi:hypothetical protein NOVO_00140 [Rickettsiales bacterium Ac37b]|nr:hypothetical protein NOVO_00140 [Rickettsiales bacterium Ac37b]